MLVLGALHLPYEMTDAYLDCRLEDHERDLLGSLIERRVVDRVPTATCSARPGSAGCHSRWTSACWYRARRSPS